MTRAVPVALALAGALLAAGCSAEEDPDGPRGVDPGLPDGEIHYVALGDSFTSGPFIDEARTDPVGCGRSTQNYPAFLADWLDVASYTDVSCAGASTANLVEPHTTLDGGAVGPQLDALSEDTNLVTMGLGANDFVIYSRLVQCRDVMAQCPVDDLLSSAEAVEPRISVAVERVRSRAPEAEIHVIGYPQILPPGTGCEAVTAPAEVLARLDEVMDALNTSLREGAEAAGASYVDLSAPSQGHDVCTGDQAWIVDQHGEEGEGAHFHPDIDGMRAAAAAVHRELTGQQAPSSEQADPDEDVVVLNEG